MLFAMETGRRNAILAFRKHPTEMPGLDVGKATDLTKPDGIRHPQTQVCNPLTEQFGESNRCLSPQKELRKHRKSCKARWRRPISAGLRMASVVSRTRSALL